MVSCAFLSILDFNLDFNFNFNSIYPIVALTAPDLDLNLNLILLS